MTYNIPLGKNSLISDLKKIVGETAGCKPPGEGTRLVVATFHSR